MLAQSNSWDISSDFKVPLRTIQQLTSFESLTDIPASIFDPHMEQNIYQEHQRIVSVEEFEQTIDAQLEGIRESLRSQFTTNSTHFIETIKTVTNDLEASRLVSKSVCLKLEKSNKIIQNGRDSMLHLVLRKVNMN